MLNMHRMEREGKAEGMCRLHSYLLKEFSFFYLKVRLMTQKDIMHAF
ncbi:hypothetical protein MDG893_01195 [Marinobacter algicola DG893]|uniref:Uncharacterized protein n=1 Tax=Marinobacter algicola DG893 TaxID=443152 RepID=A6F1H9_9GAMM|nr:hypothetical protein MDG893_01195 [Marinobacter algicola DG893]